MKKSAPAPSLDEELLKLLVYSNAGHGKTTVLGSAVGDPRLSPVLILDLEGGVSSIRSKVRKITLDELGKVEPEIDHADVIKIKTWNDFQQVYDILDSGQHGYRTVGLDSVTEINYLCLSTVLGESVKATPSRDPDMLQVDDYNKGLTKMRRLLRFVRDLPIHVICVCGAMDVTDPKSRKPQVRPSLVGKLGNELPGLLDTIAYLAIVEEGDQTLRCLYFRPTERFFAKDRSEGGRLGESLDIPDHTYPTLPTILDRLTKEE